MGAGDTVLFMRFSSRRTPGLAGSLLLSWGLLLGSLLSVGVLLPGAAAAQDAAQDAADEPAQEESEELSPEGGLVGDIEEPEEEASSPLVEPPAEEPSGGGAEHPSDVGFVVLGVGLGLLGVAVPVGGTAAYSTFELEDGCSEGVCPTSLESTRDTAETAALVTDVLLGVGGATTLAGLILLFVLTEEAEESPVQGAALCGPTGCQLSLGGRF